MTDRCNLRCAYCMPEEEYTWLAKEKILRFEETAQLVDVFLRLGVDKVRLTGGEPLLRRDLPELIRLLAAKEGLRDIAMTTNGTRLADHASELRAAGLGRLTISLDTLDRRRFEVLTRRDELGRILEGLDAARDAGFEGTKINVVVMRDVNDDELIPPAMSASTCRWRAMSPILWPARRSVSSRRVTANRSCRLPSCVMSVDMMPSPIHSLSCLSPGDMFSGTVTASRMSSKTCWCESAPTRSIGHGSIRQP